ncbi:hypothetical protein GCM10009775_18490 [Microbacterium aoyamense]|uniref:Glycosyltransferase 2-like domain-containing protein n=1 Tax=Microbacterium aoyamense TaxID=344166 RepID=A0ABN2PNY3_9MICO|nr:hypothetical protein [Microbacterium aoyamense]
MPFVDVVIACHDPSRPLERAVRSVLADPDVRDDVRVTVVAHGIPGEPLAERLAGIDGAWRVEEFSDGIRSPAGPFNRGLDLVDAEYCSVMGSDDFLEAGTMSRWVAHARRESPDALIGAIRIDGLPVMPNPLARLRRRRRLDAAKDRLFYRTAPLGLIRTATMRAMGLRMTEGVRVGEDFEFGIRLFAQSSRVDRAPGSPCYVIGVDAAERTTHARLTIEETFAPISRLLDEGVAASLGAAHRRALAVKLIRVSVIGYARARPKPEDWDGDAEVRSLADLLARLQALAPRTLAPFNIQDRGILDTLRDHPDVVGVVDAVAHAARAGRRERWLTPDLIHSFARESTLRRYVLYVLNRERKATRP